MRKLVVVCVMLLAGLSQAATPAAGVPLQVRRGFFTETDIGGIVNFGGADDYSNLQAYVQLGLGYSVPVNVTAHGSLIDIGLHVGIGASSQNCYGQRQNPSDHTSKCIGAAANTTVADNFTMTFLSVTAAFLFGVEERFYVGPKLFGGVTLLDPPPDAEGTRFGPSAGVGAALEYATNMDHLTIGLDVAFRFIIGPNIPSLQFYPRVKYTF